MSFPPSPPITLSKAGDGDHTQLVFNIDMNRDIISSVEFEVLGQTDIIQGQIEFEYLALIGATTNAATPEGHIARDLPTEVQD